MRRLYNNPADMEPIAPAAADLESLALEVIRNAERLSNVLHPLTRAAVTELVPLDEQLLLKLN